jgi:hypothetical protein
MVICIIVLCKSLLCDDDDCHEHRRQTWHKMIRDLELKAVEILEQDQKAQQLGIVGRILQQ